MELESGMLEQELGVGAWTLELLELGAWSYWSRGVVAGAGAGPTRDPGKHLYFFAIVELQRSVTKKATLRCNATFPLLELRCNVATVTFFFFFAAVAFFFLLFCCVAA